MNLLYVDESHRYLDNGLHLQALTGVLVPADRHDEARRRFYALLHERVDVGGRVITTRDGRQMRIVDGMHVNEPPPELHGVKLLPDRDDEEKLAACRKVVDVVVESGLTIFRVCLGMNDTQWRALRTDGERYLLCWIYLVELLEPVLARAPIAAVFDDGNNEIKRTIPPFLQTKQFLRALYPRPERHIGQTEPYANLLGEIAFADSRDSIMVQVADIASYVLLARDAVLLDPPGTAFKESLADVAFMLPDAALRENRSGFEWRGSQHVLTPMPAPARPLH